MASIKLKTIELVYFDIKNKVHLEYMKKIIRDESIFSRFQGILPALNSRNSFFDKAFLISYRGEFIGLVKIGKYNDKEHTVYINGFAIDKEHRGVKLEGSELSLGYISNNEINEYIFNTYPQVESIMITVSTENPTGKKAAIRYGYSQISDIHFLRRK